jgi:hypothetical protein
MFQLLIESLFYLTIFEFLTSIQKRNKNQYQKYLKIVWRTNFLSKTDT